MLSCLLSFKQVKYMWIKVAAVQNNNNYYDVTSKWLYKGYCSRVRFNQLRCACSKIVRLSCTKLMRNHLLFGKKRQSPAWTVTNDQGTSETLGYFNKSTA